MIRNISQALAQIQGGQMNTKERVIHTPTPLFKHVFEDGHDIILRPDGSQVGIFDFEEAMLITKSVNSYEAMREALQIAADFIDSVENFNDEAREALEQIKEALVAAEGRE